ncbi:MAG: GlcG/HbpS family heme-binding protein, partial [Gammaproteobacteria bacterium]
MNPSIKAVNLALFGALSVSGNGAFAAPAADPCQSLADALGVANTRAALHTALQTAVDAEPVNASGGFNLGMWATLVDRDGIVCAVAFSGGDRGSQWPASRVISAQKASTANSLSLDGLALSTANLYASAQDGGSLFGVQFSNPVDPANAYAGNPENYGQFNDPMVSAGAADFSRVGGHN